MRCDLCDREAVTFVRYNGSHLCDRHFMRYVDRRVKREIRKQIDVQHGDRIAVAVSGGKDSMVALKMISSVFGPRNGVEVHAITIDEGIEGYRPPSVDIVRRFCESNGVHFHLRSFTELGVTMDEAAPVSGDSSPCTYCGVVIPAEAVTSPLKFPKTEYTFAQRYSDVPSVKADALSPRLQEDSSNTKHLSDSPAYDMYMPFPELSFIVAPLASVTMPLMVMSSTPVRLPLTFFVPSNDCPQMEREVNNWFEYVAYKSATLFVVPPTVTLRFVAEEEDTAVSNPLLCVPSSMSAFKFVFSVPLFNAAFPEPFPNA